MVAPLPGIDEIATVRSAFASSGRVDLQVIEDADVERVTDTVRAFRPHVFHSAGMVCAPKPTLANCSSRRHRSRPPCTADRLAVMLYERRSLAVLMGATRRLLD